MSRSRLVANTRSILELLLRVTHVVQKKGNLVTCSVASLSFQRIIMILYNGELYFAVSLVAAAVFLSPSRHRYHGAFTMSFSDTVTSASAAAVLGPTLTAFTSDSAFNSKTERTASDP